MELIELNVEKRNEQGSTAIRQLRKAGSIPGVLYSEGKESVALTVDGMHFHKKTDGVPRTHLIQLTSASADLNGRKALIKDMQIEPIKQVVMHFDLYEVHAGRRIVITIPVELVGESPAVKQKQGILEQSLYEVEVECDPTQIPEKLELDISKLELNHSIFAGDIVVPEGTKLKTDKQLNVVSIVVPQEEVQAATTATTTATTTPEATAAAPSAGGAAKEGKKGKE
ncbi:MAG: 50S ribosomal protein L25 [Deltaproteobacteria bacterium]|nr:50S ribosomal protein L25 [Deltaproteobacteria bacterium]